ncbi:hypothetical protein [Planomonospora parontospora]|uniref:hypothetical protein n=1 Tax=Planomonospora parontospora TaxID=58119 RepID=UPI00166F9F0A|nr:hypothetical protein [Planomonospora parontospora]
MDVAITTVSAAVHGLIRVVLSILFRLENTVDLPASRSLFDHRLRGGGPVGSMEGEQIRKRIRKRKPSRVGSGTAHRTGQPIGRFDIRAVCASRQGEERVRDPLTPKRAEHLYGAGDPCESVRTKRVIKDGCDI